MHETSVTVRQPPRPGTDGRRRSILATLVLFASATASVCGAPRDAADAKPPWALQHIEGLVLPEGEPRSTVRLVVARGLPIVEVSINGRS
ncbi:MAG: hypothetical protein ACYTJ0_12240, partial [Planctomycetota bacterium]